MINTNVNKKLEITTKEDFLIYFNDMLSTIFNANIKNSHLVFDKKNKFVINTYID